MSQADGRSVAAFARHKLDLVITHKMLSPFIGCSDESRLHLADTIGNLTPEPLNS